MFDLRRREFIALLGGAAAAWPLAARAQQPLKVPTIGFLHSGSPEPFAPYVGAFHQGLQEAGYFDGRNIAIEYGWAENKIGRLSALAAELVRRPVALIMAGSQAATLAAKGATTTIPIVFVTADDPVTTGLVASLNRPSGNMTGVSFIGAALRAKNLELLHELVPTAAVISVLVNPNNPNTESQLRDVQAAASTIGKKIHVLNAGTERDIDAAFAILVQGHAGALIVGNDPLFLIRRDQIVTLAAQHAVPTIYFLREFAVTGGLMSYGTSLADTYRLAGTYSGRVLKGEKPADLPVQQATRVEFVINLKTAKALGLVLPLPLIGRADEVIE